MPSSKLTRYSPIGVPSATNRLEPGLFGPPPKTDADAEKREADRALEGKAFYLKTKVLS